MGFCFNYQGQENSIGQNWENFDLRTYNYDLGRFNSPDPKGQFASSYVGMGNNPISGTDPTGGYVNGGTPQQWYGVQYQIYLQNYSDYINYTGQWSPQARQAAYQAALQELINKDMGINDWAGRSPRSPWSAQLNADIANLKIQFADVIFGTRYLPSGAAVFSKAPPIRQSANLESGGAVGGVADNSFVGDNRVAEASLEEEAGLTPAQGQDQIVHEIPGSNLINATCSLENPDPENITYNAYDGFHAGSTMDFVFGVTGETEISFSAREMRDNIKITDQNGNELFQAAVPGDGLLDWISISDLAAAKNINVTDITSIDIQIFQPNKWSPLANDNFDLYVNHADFLYDVYFPQEDGNYDPDKGSHGVVNNPNLQIGN